MSSLKYFDLTIPAPRRLAMMRADYASHAARYPYCPESLKPGSWRDVRRYTLKTYAAAFALASRGSNDGQPVIYAHDEGSLPVRSIRRAYDVDGSGVNHRGYYADDSGDQGLIVPIVASLSHGRYLSGYHWTENDERVIFLTTVFDDESEAARDADHEAEQYVETCREHNALFDAMQDAEQLVEEKERDLCDAWADYKAAQIAYLQDPKRFAAQVIKAREWVLELITDIRAFRREFDDAKEAYEGA